MLSLALCEAASSSRTQSALLTSLGCVTDAVTMALVKEEQKKPCEGPVTNAQKSDTEQSTLPSSNRALASLEERRKELASEGPRLSLFALAEG